MDGLDPVDDEWAWPTSLMEGRQLEGFLRCQVCGEFMNGPVLLRNCRHCFCSECVRKHLLARGTNGNCPECKQACSSGDLVPNRPLEMIIDHFRGLKGKVLALANGATVPITTPIKTHAQPKAKDGECATKRMPVVSYNLMKDKKIQELLDSVGLREIRGNRDTLIATHKEYTMLWNAQLDTLHPKSPNEIRQQILRNYRLRTNEKYEMASTKRSLGLRHDEPIEKAITASSTMNDNFRKLAEQIRAQKRAKTQGASSTDPSPAKPQAPSSSKLLVPSPLRPATSSTPPKIPSHKHPQALETPPPKANFDSLHPNASASPEFEDEEKPAHPDLLPDGDLRYLPRETVAPKVAFGQPVPVAAAGTWRRVILNSTQQQVYVHSGTTEVRTEPPPGLFAQTTITKRVVEAPPCTTTWACPRCTLLNEYHVDECVACGGPNAKKRPKRVIQKKLSLG
ncbi:E3 ubiquitin ligase [Achlya hypogyna]|uniref:RanBP-type and C3HC4-type zinc finger-containing protein 1 n=1 Tax=Achlya hypogyna TaxID=1202772 RepID=A0A1V9Z4M0_ACHHY|nr:E3 ubiquitin ligase [Achlya hypogyna]